MKFKTVAKIGGAVVAVMAVEPTTLLAKCTCALVGGALGAVVADPLQKEIETLTLKIAALNMLAEEAVARMAQTSVPPS